MNTTYLKRAAFLSIAFLMLSVSLKSQLYINEFMASNMSAAADPDYGLYSDWLEIYNAGASVVDLSNYYLTDNLNDSTKWQIPGGTTIPSGGYLVFWADGANTGVHTNFKLSSSGEEIGLFNSSGSLIDSYTYPAQRTDYSMGRSPDGSTSWIFFSNGTLEATNNGTSFSGISASPQFSLQGGFYTSAQSLSLSYPFGLGEIRYTTDGTEPTASSTLYSSPISISTTTVIRAIAFESGKLESNVINHSFFINEPDQTLPVISISSAPANFWDAVSGFYVNYDEEWEKPIGIEFYEDNGALGFSANAGISIFGGATRGAAQKAFTINFSPQYGIKEVNYKIFDNVDRKNFGSFVLRNGGNNWYNTENFNPVLFCDAIQHTIFQGQLDIDLMPFRPASVYINGEYWGILNIREKTNEEYIEAHYGYDEDSLDLVKLGKNMPNDLIAGDSIHFYNMVEYMKANDMTQAASYDYIKTQMDVKEFINYQIAEIYTANFDWPDNNCKFWRPQTADGKWRWMLFDLDFGFNGHPWGAGSYGKWMGYYRNSYNDALNPNLNEWSTIVMRKLNENQDFTNEFAQTMAHHINTTFDPIRVNGIIDGVDDLVSTEMDRHIDRWGSEGGISSLNQWSIALGRMKVFANLRPGLIFSYTKNQYNLWPVSLKIETDHPMGGYITVNDLLVPSSDFTGKYFKDIPLNLKAYAHPGYTFKGWEYKSTVVNTTVLIDLDSQWSYLDNGSDQGTAWKEISFNDASWATGNGEFGYGEGDENTVVSYGPDPDNKYITTYFRKDFNVTNVSELEKLHLNLFYDDGLVIYINGNLAASVNMPDVVDYRTGSVSGVDNAFMEYVIDNANLLVEGNNVIAVEVHQYELSSSDLSFNLSLTASNSAPGDSGVIVTTDFLYNNLGDGEIKAVFDKKYNLYINEVCSWNLDNNFDEYSQPDDWIEIYNAADTAIDLGGLYMSDNISNPDLWRIPDTNPLLTTVQPNDFIILWADNTPTQGENHLGFSLGRTGEEIGLFDIDSIMIAVIDTFSFDSIGPNKTYGRFPEESINLQKFDLATPLDINNDTIIIPVIPDNLVEQILSQEEIHIYPNPASDVLNIKIINSITSQAYPMKIYTITGMLVDEIMVTDKEQSIDISFYKSGVYILYIKANNKLITKKIIKS